jgi:hypothetical protein
VKYRLVCCDVDGTLIDNQGSITEENQNIVRELEKRGIGFSICSGRLFKAVDIMVQHYCMDAYIIASSGAVVYNTKDRKILNLSVFDFQEVQRLIEYGEKHNLIIGLNTLNDLYVNSEECVEIPIYENANKLYASGEDKIQVHVVKDLKECPEEEKYCKISFWTKNEEDYQKIRHELEALNKYSIATAMPRNLELSPKSVTKWSGIEVLTKRMGIDEKNVISFGDSMNDYHMIKNAGFGVCMENGEEELKKRADYITKSNEESGVAFLINKLLEGGEFYEKRGI